MTKTREDLITATLDLLNAIGAGQAPEAEDVEEIDGLIDGKVAELNRRDIIFFTDTETFEDEFVDPLATILADMAAPAFGQARKPESVAEAISRLYAMRPSTYVSGSVAKTDYF
ncbi:hypothetical protein ACMFL9_12015 (plasmid) [Sinorhizobium meliloti]